MTPLNNVIFQGYLKVGQGRVRSVAAGHRNVKWLVFNDGFVDIGIPTGRKLVPLHNVQEMEPENQEDPRKAVDTKGTKRTSPRNALQDSAE